MHQGLLHSMPFLMAKPQCFYFPEKWAIGATSSMRTDPLRQLHPSSVLLQPVRPPGTLHDSQHTCTHHLPLSQWVCMSMTSSHGRDLIRWKYLYQGSGGDVRQINTQAAAIQRNISIYEWNDMTGNRTATFILDAPFLREMRHKKTTLFRLPLQRSTRDPFPGLGSLELDSQKHRFYPRPMIRLKQLNNVNRVFRRQSDLQNCQRG